MNGSADIPPEIIVPPSQTTAVEYEDYVNFECVANARFVSKKGSW
jgi:hypothetical protein